MTRKLYFGDNLEIMRRHIADESIDLVYLDPPFNSKKVYNVLFKSPDSGTASAAQIEAFDDTWSWSPETQKEYEYLIGDQDVPAAISKTIEAFRSILGEADLMAYLVMMAPRLIEIRRVLKQQGSMYLHCDPTASHYLKVICDHVFAGGSFINEVVWYYKGAGISPRYWARRHDILLWYGKSKRWYFNPDPVRGEYAETTKERFAHYIGNVRGAQDYGQQALNPKGKHPDDVWELPILAPSANERLGYPTQKPEHLLERVILSSSKEGQVVLDPFCGCGTTVAVAENLKRSWIGIDISYLAISLIEQRLMDSHPGVKHTVHGVPRDIEGAKALFNESAKNFEMWAVRQVGGRPQPKMGGDEGIDGVIRFYMDGREWGTVLVSVKGGDMLNPVMVRELVGSVRRTKADMGILITRVKPTKGMYETAAKDGYYRWPSTGQEYQRIQVVTVEELLQGKTPKLPPIHGTYAEAPRMVKGQGEQLELGSS